MSRLDSVSKAEAMHGLGLQFVHLPTPISTNRVVNFDAATVKSDALSTRIVVPARFPDLVGAFLAHKRKHGSSYEKRLYDESWTWKQQVARLIEKRPLVFVGAGDYTVLRDGKTLPGAGAAEWDRVGTEDEKHNVYLALDEYLSYDEIMLGSLIGVSGPSHFINDGNRYNRGRRSVGSASPFEPRGIIIGLVGARFERDDRMDSVHILPSVSSPRQHPELSRVFQDFFGATKNPSSLFDVPMYKGRIRVTLELLLLEANARATEAGRKAHVYIVGLGLGVWQQTSDQPGYYLKALAESISDLGARLSQVASIEVGWIKVPDQQQQEVLVAAEQFGITAKFTTNNPADKLSGEDSEKLLVISYAWDGNSFPGNEYWTGSLAGSGDPAAACMSTISELHNPLVNPGFLERIEVLG